jgi:hypothetical protein
MSLNARIPIACGLLAASLAGSAQAQQYGGPCVLPDNGSGTVDLPPAGCAYLSPDEFHQIVNGLPPGTKINIAPEHRALLCSPVGTICENPGGTLGGTTDTFTSELGLVMQGTGPGLSGFSRVINLPVSCEAHTGPRNPGQPVQSFPTDMFMLQGQILGDPDFDLLRITGGTAFGMPSPGHTTLTRLGPPGSPFHFDSFFDIEYRIDFVGAPGGSLAGMSGSTTATIRMEAHGPNSFASTTFCDASDGSLASCPCGNAGNPDSGCDIQQATGGVKLTIQTQQTSPQNRSTMQGTGYPITSTPSSVVIRGSALDGLAPVVFGDGLRCVGLPTVRLGATIASGGSSTHVVGHGAMAPAGPGTFYYQLWFRNQPAMFCTPDAFNLSSGRSLTW